MASSPRPGALGYNEMCDLNWSPGEKTVARKAFDRALQRELEAVMVEAKNRAAMIHEASDLWELERYLTERRTQIDRQYEYKYSVLILVFGNLIRQGRLNEQEVLGLNQEKLDAIRRYADFEFSAGLKQK